MTGGFSFCGTDIATLGLEYVPNKEDTWVYGQTKYKASEESFEAHDGGYFYGTTAQPKDFKLRMYFTENDIRRGVLTRAQTFFRIGRSGRLVFDRRPWCWYNATVTNYDESQMTNYRNGFIQVSMRAYYPFARSDQMFIDDIGEYETSLVENTAFIKEADVQNRKLHIVDVMNRENVFDVFGWQKTVSKSAPLSVYMFNPGTRRAPLAIELDVNSDGGGLGGGLTVENATTGQTCEFYGSGSDENVHLICDSLNGKTIEYIPYTNGTPTLAFNRHNKGFIYLEPAFPLVRDIATTLTMPVAEGENTKIYNQDGLFSEDTLGKTVFMRLMNMKTDGSLTTIVFSGNITKVIDQYTVEVDNTPIQQTIDNYSADGSTLQGISSIILLNKLVITPVSTSIKFNSLKFHFKPTFD